MQSGEGPRAVVGDQPQWVAARSRSYRRLRFRLLFLLALFTLPGLLLPWRYLTPHHRTVALGGEVFFLAAVAAGIISMLPGRSNRQGAVWAALAAVLVAAGYGFVTLL